MIIHSPHDKPRRRSDQVGTCFSQVEKEREKKQSKVVERREGAGRFYLHPNVEGEKKRKGKICERKFNDLATNKSVMGSCWTIVSFSSDDSSTSIRTPPHEESCVARQMLMTATPTAIGCGAD